VPLDLVIRNRRVEPDAWRFLDAGQAAGALPGGRIAVPLPAWQARREELLGGHDPIGVWLAADDDPVALKRDLTLVDLVAVHFPKFADGRGYSTGALLRGRLRFEGELRAFGDIGRDHLLQLERCGFDAFALAPGRDPHAALAAFDEFSVRYQGSVDDPVPLFRRRAGLHG
jgi:uncharacterized protein (DUF934 family)